MFLHLPGMRKNKRQKKKEATLQQENNGVQSTGRQVTVTPVFNGKKYRYKNHIQPVICATHLVLI